MAAGCSRARVASPARGSRRCPDAADRGPGASEAGKAFHPMTGARSSRPRCSPRSPHRRSAARGGGGVSRSDFGADAIPRHPPPKGFGARSASTRGGTGALDATDEVRRGRAAATGRDRRDGRVYPRAWRRPRRTPDSPGCAISRPAAARPGRCPHVERDRGRGARPAPARLRRGLVARMHASAPEGGRKASPPPCDYRPASPLTRSRRVWPNSGGSKSACNGSAATRAGMRGGEDRAPLVGPREARRPVRHPDRRAGSVPEAWNRA